MEEKIKPFCYSNLSNEPRNGFAATRLKIVGGEPLIFEQRDIIDYFYIVLSFGKAALDNIKIASRV